MIVALIFCLSPFLLCSSPCTTSLIALFLLPLEPQNCKCTSHTQGLLLTEVEFKCKFCPMQHCNVHMQKQVTYAAKVVLAEKKTNKCVCFSFGGLTLERGG